MNTKNESFNAVLAARKNGYVNRDTNGNDISYLMYLKYRRRECKSKGLLFNATAEEKWFRDNIL